MDRRHRWTNLAPALVREGLRRAETPRNDLGEPELMIYDYIDSWGGEWGVSAADVIAALTEVGNVPALSVRLNSPGGDYFEGVAIFNALVRHPANVTVYVDALAASAASVIAMAGNKVVMGAGSQLMIHEARSGIFGATADDYRAQAAMLDQTNDDIAGFYAARTDGDLAAWRAAVAVETWYTAAAAVEAGLADEIAAPPQRAGLGSTEAPAARAAVVPPPAERPEPLAPDATPQTPADVADAPPSTELPTAEDASPVTALPTVTVDLAALIRTAARI